MRRSARLFLAACCLAALRTPLAAQEPARRQVAEIRLEGVRALPHALVLAVLETRGRPCRSFVLAPFCALGAGWARRPAPLDPAAVARDTTTLRRLYADWGYPDARADFEIVPRSARSARVVFRVTEGAPLLVRSLRVQGLEGTGVTVPPLPLRPGHPYGAVLLDESQRVILALLSRAGRPFAQVEASGDVAAAAHAADVVLRVEPGPVAVFGRTTVVARAPLSENVVRRRVAWREGARFDPGALDRTRERLARVPVVDTALVLPAPRAQGDSVVDVAVTVSAGRIAALQGAGGISASACLSGQAWWSDRYLAGKPRVVTLAAGASNLLVSRLGGFPCTSAAQGPFADPDYFARADWREPVGADSWLLLSAGYARQSAPGAYIQRGVDARISLDRSLRPGLEAVLSYTPSRTASTAGAPFFCALFGVCAGPRLDALQSTTTLAPLGLQLTWAPPAHARRLQGPRNAALAALAAAPAHWLYTAGAALSGAAPATLSDARFARVEATAAVTRLLGRRIEIAARVRAGALADFGDTLPPQLRLFGGGPDGVRGAQQNLLGPRFLLADSSQLAALGCASRTGGCPGVTVHPDQVLVRATGGDRLLETGLEARAWVSGSLQLAAFLDYGYVHGGALAGAPSDVAPAESMLAPGIGIRFLSPLGPVRFDLGYDPTRTVAYPLLASRSDGTFLNIGEALYDPYGGGGGGAFTRLRRRIQLQFSLGQPF